MQPIFHVSGTAYACFARSQKAPQHTDWGKAMGGGLLSETGTPLSLLRCCTAAAEADFLQKRQKYREKRLAKKNKKKRGAPFGTPRD